MKFLQEYPNCSNCNTELDENETTNWWCDEGYEIYLARKGTCPNCGKEFSWMEEYVYTGFINLKEED